MIDNVYLNFNPTTLTIMNIVIGFIMFGVALDLRAADFKRVVRSPKPFLIGMLGQYLFLPAFTLLLVYLLNPIPSIALGMILLAACPGGNLSNFLTHLSRGNTPLSISMSAFSTALAIIMTPLNLAFWGSLHPDTRAILREVSIGPLDMLMTIFLLLGLPLILGISVARYFPKFAARVVRPMRIFSIIFFIAFVLFALAGNFEYFLEFVGAVMFYVFLQNVLALFSGYTSARLIGLPEADRRAIAIEVGIQNSGLGLILVFNFFDGLGGMAIVLAWWGIWHVVTGLPLAFFWSKRPPKQAALPNEVSL